MTTVTDTIAAANEQQEPTRTYHWLLTLQWFVDTAIANATTGGTVDVTAGASRNALYLELFERVAADVAAKQSDRRVYNANVLFFSLEPDDL